MLRPTAVHRPHAARADGQALAVAHERDLRVVVLLAPVRVASENHFGAVVRPGGLLVLAEGQRFNGPSQAVSYGDDAAAATNYPLVRETAGSESGSRRARTATAARPPS